MKSSIYISSDKIEIIGYRKSSRGVIVKDFASCPLPEGVMINGKILDQTALAEALSALRKEKPRLFSVPALAVDGNSILVKRLAVPKLKKRLYLQLVQDDFAETSDQHGEGVFGWHMLQPPGDKPGEMLACAAEKEQVESYIATFAAARSKLKAVRVGVEAVLCYVRSREDLRRESFVLNIIDGVMMLSMIFNHGNNVFITRTRLYRDDYQQYIRGLLENLSGLVQFNKSEKFSDIQRSYYLGLREEDLNFMRAVWQNADFGLENLDIFTGVKGGEKLPPDAYFVFLSTLLDADNIDLIESLKNYHRQKKRQRPKKYWLPLFVALLILLAIPAGWLFKETNDLNVQVYELQRNVLDEGIMAQVQELDDVVEMTSAYQGVAAQLDNKTKYEESLMRISNLILDVITKTCSDKVTVQQLSFDESKRMITVNGRSQSESDSAEYVEALRNNVLVNGVTYTGYNYNSDGSYEFSIDVWLARGGIGQ